MIFAAVTCLVLLLPHVDAREAFMKGGELYANGSFEEALETYRTEGEHAGLFRFNEGNCLFRLSRYSEALHSYLSALYHLPRRGEVRRNIDVVRARLNLESVSYPGAWKFFTSMELLSLAMLIACPAMWLLAYRYRKRKAWMIRLALFLILISVVLFLISVVPGSRSGIAAGPIQVRSEPAVGEVLFSLREGVDVSIVEEQNGWFRIKDEKNRCGWARSGDLLPLP